MVAFNDPRQNSRDKVSKDLYKIYKAMTEPIDKKGYSSTLVTAAALTIAVTTLEEMLEHVELADDLGIEILEGRIQAMKDTITDILIAETLK